MPSEQEILRRDVYRDPKYSIPDEVLTGVNTLALAYVASHALSISETPTVAFENMGGFNALLRIEFPQDGRKLLARIPFRTFSAVSRIESSVATMSFSMFVRNIPTPRIFAWNASNDNPVGAPYIFQEYMEGVVEPWQVWGSASDNMRSCILNELARWHAAFLEPLPHPLHGVGDLSFAPGLSATAALSDPKSYIVRPFQLPEPLLSSVSLVHLWDRLWSHQVGLCASEGGSRINLEALGLDDNEQCDSASFVGVAVQARIYAEDALRVLEQYPAFALPCLVNYDYAYRNILLDRRTYRVKAFIDWDDVHVMPFIVGVDFPEDIKEFSVDGLSPESNYYHEGAFQSFPPDEHGEIVGAVDKDGKLIDAAVCDRVERIRNTAFREQFVRALETQDGRVAQPDMWKVRRKVLKAHHLLTTGGRMWWEKRKWLSKQLGEVALAS